MREREREREKKAGRRESRSEREETASKRHTHNKFNVILCKVFFSLSPAQPSGACTRLGRCVKAEILLSKIYSVCGYYKERSELWPRDFNTQTHTHTHVRNMYTQSSLNPWCV